MPLINFSGIASGIDTEGLIKATSDATRSARESPLQNKIQELTDENDTLTTLKTKLNSIKEAALKFATLNGGALTKQATSTNESVIGATASNAASNGRYTVTVNALASNGIYKFNDAFSSLTAPIDATLTTATYPVAADRYLTIETGTGSNKETINVELTDTTTLADIINTFNQSSTKAVMSAVNVSTVIGTPDYRLVVSSVNEGTELGTIAVSTGSALTTTAHFQAGTSTAAADSDISITGIGNNIVRASNSISDIVPGVTLSLVSTGGPATITVGDDVTTTTSKVQDFVDAWNSVVTYLAQNNLVQRQENGENVSNIFGPLAKTRVDDNAIAALRSQLSSAFVHVSSSQNIIFPDLGVKTQRDGSLQFDTSAFQSIISSNSGAVNTLLKTFSDAISLTGGTIEQFTGFNRLIDTTINSNRTQITDLNNRVAEIEKNIAANEAAMRARFARLEASIGTMQSQQNSLTAALGGLSNSRG